MVLRDKRMIFLHDSKEPLPNQSVLFHGQLADRLFELPVFAFQSLSGLIHSAPLK